jgi:acyl-CoA synthetase (AMP-forming)/AMP-acid ligase II
MLLDLIHKHNAQDIAIRDAKSVVTWGELQSTLKELLYGWQEANILLGKQNTAIFLENNVDSIVCLFAAIAAGQNVVLLDPNLTTSDWEYVVRILKPKLCFASVDIFKRLSIGDKGITIDDALTKKAVSSSLIENSQGYVSGGVYFLTSGSTGRPKFVKRSLESLINEGASYANTLKLTNEDVFFNGLPLYHAFACGCALFGTVKTGGSLLLSSLFFPRHAIKWIQEYEVTLLLLIPSLVKFMVNTTQINTDISSLRYALVGTGQISTELATMFHSIFGLPLSENYGSSETGAIATRLPNLIKQEYMAGQVMYGVIVEIVNDHGCVVSHGVEGNVTVRTPSLFSEYVGEHSSEVGLELKDSWATGDIGFLSTEGILFLTGRKSSILQRNGKKINPTIIENKLSKMDGIDEVAIVGLKQKETGDDHVIAMVVTQDLSLNPVKIRSYLLQHLDTYMIPGEIYFIAQLPRTNTGKVDRSSLKSIVINHMETRK